MNQKQYIVWPDKLESEAVIIGTSTVDKGVEIASEYFNAPCSSINIIDSRLEYVAKRLGVSHAKACST